MRAWHPGTTTLCPGLVPLGIVFYLVKMKIIWLASAASSVPAALLGWGLSPRLESLQVMGTEAEEGNGMKGIPARKWWFGFGWKLVLPDENKKSNALPGATTE